MDPEFWLEKWQANEIGFHRDSVNPLLERYWPQLGADAECPVFVPLCGKSHDLLWLRGAGHRVVGVELSPLAIEQFFAENGLQPDAGELRGMPYLEAEGVRLLQGDFFHLEPEHLAGVAAVYDRAALIALPPDRQPHYAEHLRSILPDCPPALTITLEYGPGEMQGPPFSTASEQIGRLFGGWYAIDLLESVDALFDNPGLRARGLSALVESVWRLRPLDTPADR